MSVLWRKLLDYCMEPCYCHWKALARTLYYDKYWYFWT